MSTAVYREAAEVAIVSLVLLAIGICVHHLLGAVAMRYRRQLLGVLLILAVVVLWTGSSVAVQTIFESAHFRKPFYVTYLSTSLLVVYLPFYPRRVAALAAAIAAECGVGGAASTSTNAKRRRVSYELLASAACAPGADKPDAAVSRHGPLAELFIALRLSLIFFGQQLCFNIGLELSTVATVTVIAATSGLWTLLFSKLLLHERVGPIKLLSTLLTFCGVLVVVVTSAPPAGRGSAALRPWWGNGMASLSALLYGVYASLLRREVPTEESMPIGYLFGLIGAAVFVGLLPAIPVLHVLHLERFSRPSNGTLLALTLNALLGSVASNVLLARAMLLASPLIATVGLSLSIPLAIASDAVRGRGAHFAEAGPLLGTAAAWLGFLGVSAAEPLEERCTPGTPTTVDAATVARAVAPATSRPSSLQRSLESGQGLPEGTSVRGPGTPTRAGGKPYR